MPVKVYLRTKRLGPQGARGWGWGWGRGCIFCCLRTRYLTNIPEAVLWTGCCGPGAVGVLEPSLEQA